MNPRSMTGAKSLRQKALRGLLSGHDSFSSTVPPFHDGMTRSKSPRHGTRGSVVAIAIAVSTAGLTVPSVAVGQAPPPLPPGLAPEEKLDEQLRATPRAPDERAGHFFTRAHSDIVLPVGYVTTDGSLEDVFAGGFTAGGSLGIGLSPSLELDATGEYGLLGASGDCETCEGTLLNVGLGIRAHLVEGASLDPWIRFGVAYRGVSLVRGEDEVASVLAVAPGDYHGIDVAQISLGADYFPVRGFGLGPFIAFDIGTNVAWPDGLEATAEARPYAFLSLGVDITLDPVGMATPPSKPAPAPAPKETARASNGQADIISSHAESVDGR